MYSLNKLPIGTYLLLYIICKVKSYAFPFSLIYVCISVDYDKPSHLAPSLLSALLFDISFMDIYPARCWVADSCVLPFRHPLPP